MAEEFLSSGGGEPMSSSPRRRRSLSSLGTMASSSRGYGSVAMEAVLAGVCGTDGRKDGLISPGRFKIFCQFFFNLLSHATTKC
jgi:hypothetical protein